MLSKTLSGRVDVDKASTCGPSNYSVRINPFVLHTCDLFQALSLCFILGSPICRIVFTQHPSTSLLSHEHGLIQRIIPFFLP